MRKILIGLWNTLFSVLIGQSNKTLSMLGIFMAAKRARLDLIPSKYNETHCKHLPVFH